MREYRTVHEVSELSGVSIRTLHYYDEIGLLTPPVVQAQVRKLQDFITANYYTCTKQILAGLGQMYVAGGDMTTNINVAGGKGCAEFVAKAIEEYCK